MSVRIRAVAGLLLGLLVVPAAAGTEPEREAIGTRALLEDIRARQKALDRREAELADRERQVEALEALVGQRMQEIETLAQKAEERIRAWEESTGDAVRRLARIYAAMPPRRAAELLEDLDLALATQVVAKMKHKQSAAVLALVSQERALAMSRNVAHPLMLDPASIDAAEAR